MLDTEPVGSRIIAETFGLEELPFSRQETEDRQTILDESEAGLNWFLVWLTQMVKSARDELGSLNTPSGKLALLLGNA